MPTIFYWILCIVILLLFDIVFRKKEKPISGNETSKEKRIRTVKSIILAVAMVGLACAISYFVRK